MNIIAKLLRSVAAACSPGSRRNAVPEVEEPRRSAGSRCPMCYGDGVCVELMYDDPTPYVCPFCKGTGTAPSGDGAMPAKAEPSRP